LHQVPNSTEHDLIDDGNKNKNIDKDSILQVRKTCQLYVESASKRLDHLVEAFSARDNSSALELVSQAKSLPVAGAKCLESIKNNMVS
jgi:hypothetical protein